jgi:hypothetical protein
MDAGSTLYCYRPNYITGMTVSLAFKGVQCIAYGRDAMLQAGRPDEVIEFLQFT